MSLLDLDYSEINQEDIISRIKSLKADDTIRIRNFSDIDTLKKFDRKIKRILSNIQANHLENIYWETGIYELHRI